MTHYSGHIKHTKERYSERFNELLSDEDYNEMCTLVISNENNIRVTKNKYKKIIIFKDKYLWVVYNRFFTIITIYPLNNKEIIRYNNNEINYQKIIDLYKKINDRKKILKKNKKFAASSKYKSSSK